MSAPVFISLDELRELCADAAALGVARMRREMEPQSDYVSQNEAWRLFGRKRVIDWLARGYLTTERTEPGNGSKRLYSRAELMAVDHATRMHTVLNRRAIEEALAQVRALK